MLFPDVDAGTAGDRLEQGGLAGPVLADKKSHGLLKCHPVRLPENVQAERVTISRREGVVEEGERTDMHACVIFSRWG
jgi:hypothetical protein